MRSSDNDLRIFILAAAGVLVFMVIFLYFAHPYDLSTGMFFSLGLGTMARRKIGPFLTLFALANFNRETTIFLTLVFAVYFIGRLSWMQFVTAIGYQIIVACLVRLAILLFYAGNPGVVAVVNPLGNLDMFLDSPVLMVLHWTGFGLLVWALMRRWQAPDLLRVTIAVLFPLLMVLYLIFGRAFEVRVFAEVFPAIWVLFWTGSARR